MDTECHLVVNKKSSRVHFNAARVAGVGCSRLIDRREKISLCEGQRFSQGRSEFRARVTSFSPNANPSVELSAPAVCIG
ncbi:hypothetical protein TNCV_336281 [Trichonephila clavipes]|nr:hypothetical protein TNCV_336281 [Trichonephila clavipes]